MSDEDYGAYQIGKKRPDGCVIVLDETMKAGHHRARAINFLEQWKNDGIINYSAWQAGDMYARDYYYAGLGPNYATMNMDRVDGGAKDGPSQKHISAKKRINRVHDDLTPQERSVLSACVGCEMSLSDYVRIARWNGRCITRDIAKGVLLVGLENLVKAYGL